MKILLVFLLIISGVLLESCVKSTKEAFAYRIASHVDGNQYIPQVSASPLIGLFNEINSYKFDDSLSKQQLLSKFDSLYIICNTGEIVRDEFNNEMIKQHIDADTISFPKYMIYFNSGESEKYSPKITLISRPSTAGASKLYKRHPDWSKDFCILISKHQVQLGMDRDMLIMSWGRPESINRSVGSWGTHEQWVYGSRNYLYLENDILTSWQN